MLQEIAFSSKSDIDAALEDILSQLKHRDKPTAVVFFASVCYDFPILAEKIYNKFPNSQVLGTSTSERYTPAVFPKIHL